MTQLLNPSQFAHECLDMSSVHGDVEDPFTCNLCGFDFPENSSGHHYKAGAKFNDHADTHGTHFLCAHCKTVTSGSTFILQNKCAFYCDQGVFSLNKDVDIACFVYAPPKPPFLAVYGMTKQQHLVWRTPVSYSNRVFHMRFGTDLFVINRANVLGTLTAYRDGLAAVNAYRHASDKKLKPLPSVFAVKTSAIRNADDVSAMIPNQYIYALLALKADDDTHQALLTTAQDSMTTLINQLNILNFGELFLMLAASKLDPTGADYHALIQQRGL